MKNIYKYISKYIIYLYSESTRKTWEGKIKKDLKCVQY